MQSLTALVNCYVKSHEVLKVNHLRIMKLHFKHNAMTGTSDDIFQTAIYNMQNFTMLMSTYIG